MKIVILLSASLLAVGLVNAQQASADLKAHAKSADHTISQQSNVIAKADVNSAETTARANRRAERVKNRAQRTLNRQSENARQTTEQALNSNAQVKTTGALNVNAGESLSADVQSSSGVNANKNGMYLAGSTHAATEVNTAPVRKTAASTSTRAASRVQAGTKTAVNATAQAKTQVKTIKPMVRSSVHGSTGIHIK